MISIYRYFLNIDTNSTNSKFNKPIQPIQLNKQENNNDSKFYLKFILQNSGIIEILEQKIIFWSLTIKKQTKESLFHHIIT